MSRALTFDDIQRAVEFAANQGMSEPEPTVVSWTEYKHAKAEAEKRNVTFDANFIWALRWERYYRTKETYDNDGSHK